MSFIGLLDILLLTVILLCAGDALRQLQPRDHPLRTLAFGLVTVGSFGWIAHDIEGHPVPWWAIALHGGFALYAVLLFIGRNPLGIPHVDRATPSIRPTVPPSLHR